MNNSGKSRWQQYKENLGETRPWDFLNPNLQTVPIEISNSRLDICKTCPELIKLTTQCKKCGCFMAAKTKLSFAECPIGKWGKHE
jgi:hypothetical protein